jgi:hypothetical protein
VASAEVAALASSWLGLGNERFGRLGGILVERFDSLGGCENEQSMELTEAASMAVAALSARARRKGGKA